jgi:hypothetical protein
VCSVVNEKGTPEKQNISLMFEWVHAKDLFDFITITNVANLETQ